MGDSFLKPFVSPQEAALRLMNVMSHRSKSLEMKMSGWKVMQPAVERSMSAAASMKTLTPAKQKPQPQTRPWRSRCIVGNVGTGLLLQKMCGDVFQRTCFFRSRLFAVINRKYSRLAKRHQTPRPRPLLVQVKLFQIRNQKHL